MGKKDPRVDAYIGRAAPFARPILVHLRTIIHQACPAAGETIKWGFPHFEHLGVICGMAAFKTHCAFGFWKAALVLGHTREEQEAMGHFGRIEKIADLPDKETLLQYVRKAAELNEAGVKKPRPAKKAKPPLIVPAELAAALRRSDKARKHFDSFSESKRREYVEWVTEAKREETRRQRVKTAVDWIGQGKIRNWRYLKGTRRPKK